MGEEKSIRRLVAPWDGYDTTRGWQFANDESMYVNPEREKQCRIRLRKFGGKEKI